MLRLTCKNDPETLRSVLDWGRRKGREVQWEDCVEPRCRVEDGETMMQMFRKKVILGEDGRETGGGRMSKSPIMIAAQQGHEECIQLLYAYGHRIPQLRRAGIGEGREGEQELLRQSKITEPPGEEDQVEKFQALRPTVGQHICP